MIVVYPRENSRCATTRVPTVENPYQKNNSTVAIPKPNGHHGPIRFDTNMATNVTKNPKQEMKP
ncbi:hypothetical protein GCM10028798_10860 [Humibacter antri]